MIRWFISPDLLSDAELLDEYGTSEAEVGDDRHDALVAEIERRGLDV